jgi:hypothetical protein
MAREWTSVVREEYLPNVTNVLDIHPTLPILRAVGIGRVIISWITGKCHTQAMLGSGLPVTTSPKIYEKGELVEQYV